MMHIDFPFQIDREGKTARTDDREHVKDLIEQVLFTAPGERVMRPNFGSGARDLVFEPNSEELAAAVEYQIRGALEQHLGDRIDVEGLRVQSAEESLRITVLYSLLNEDETQKANFEL